MRLKISHKKILYVSALVLSASFVLLTLLFAGIFGYAAFFSQKPFDFLGLDLALSGESLGAARNNFFIILIPLFVFALAFAVLYRRAQAMPLNRALASLQSLRKDYQALLTGLNELSQGNLTASFRIGTQPFDAFALGRTAGLIENVRALAANLAELKDGFDSVTSEPCKRICYVGTDSYAEGKVIGELMGRELKGKGEVIVILRSLEYVSLVLRLKGFAFALSAKYPDVKIVGVIESYADEARVEKAIKETIRNHPQLAGIYATQASLVSVVAETIKSEGKRGLVRIVGHDLIEKTYDYLKEGLLTATLLQDPMAQVHNPIVHVVNMLTCGIKPSRKRMFTEMDLITADNFARYFKGGRFFLDEDVIESRLAKPVKKADKPVRIAFLGREDNKFWLDMKAVALETGRKMLEYNIEVDFFASEGNKKEKDASWRSYGPLIESLAERGYDGIVTAIFDKNMVRYVNKAVDAGILVATYNSEPVSLLDLMTSLNQNFQLLSAVTKELSQSSKESEEITTRIEALIKGISGKAIVQSGSAFKGTEAITELVGAINDVARGASDQARAVSKSSDVTMDISQAIKVLSDTVERVKDLNAQVSHSLAQVRDMGERSKQIKGIVYTIDEIASKTKTLSINAFIEAAHASSKAGSGFSVLANEIRALSDQTTKATDEVTALINGVLSSVGSAVSNIEASSAGLTKQVGELSASNVQINSILDDLKGSIHDVSAVVEENNAAAEEMRANSQEVLKIIEFVQQLSTENQESAEEANRCAEMMYANINTVVPLIQSIGGMLQVLESELVQFKLKKDE